MEYIPHLYAIIPVSISTIFGIKICETQTSTLA